MKTSLTLLASFAFVSCTNLVSGQTDAETRAAELSQTLVKGHIAWKTKLSSPGASIQAKEMQRHAGLVRYSLYVSGLPMDKLYTVMSWPVGQAKPLSIMEGVSLGKSGVVMCGERATEQCGDSSKKDDSVDFVFNPAKGEPYRLALVAQDDRAAVVIVPDPISTSDKGCTLSIERLMPRFELAYFTGSGFPASTEVSFDSQSYDEKHTVKTKTDSGGNLQFAMMPFVTGHNKGTTTIKAVGMPCSPSAGFEWGN